MVGAKRQVVNSKTLKKIRDIELISLRREYKLEEIKQNIAPLYNISVRKQLYGQRPCEDVKC